MLADLGSGLGEKNLIISVPSALVLAVLGESGYLTEPKEVSSHQRYVRYSNLSPSSGFLNSGITLPDSML